MSTTLRSVKPEIVAAILICPVSLAGMGMLIKAAGGMPQSTLLLARFGVPAVIYWGVLAAKRYPFRSIRPHKHLLRAAKVRSNRNRRPVGKAAPEGVPSSTVAGRPQDQYPGGGGGGGV